MKHKHIDTLIIGGGISGLSCAQKLREAGKDFIIVTKEIGGRIKASESFAANYGAAYMTTDYHHILPLVKKGEVMRLCDFYFFDGKTFSNIFSLRLVKHIPRLAILLWFAWRIRNHLVRYRKQAPYQSMREYLRKDPFLLKYWLMPASEFIQKYNLQEVSRYIVDPTTSATAFVGINKVNTVYMLAMIFPVISKTWIIDFTGTIEKLSANIKENILLGEVTKVQKTAKGMYAVETSLGTITATNIVFAAPQKQLKNVYPLPERNIQQDCFVFHVSGERKKEFLNKKGVVFQDHYYDIHMLWQQRDDTDIIYTQSGNPKLNRYYHSHSIIRKIHWKPAMIIPTCCIIDQEIDDNTYIASDFNVSGLEDSYLSGLYAANRIIGIASHDNLKKTDVEIHAQTSKTYVRDPVCNMKILSAKAVRTTYHNSDYYFCGTSCQSLFKYDPERFVKL